MPYRHFCLVPRDFLKTLPLIFGFVTWSCAIAAIAPAESQADAFADVLQPLFQQHCVQCHGRDETTEGEVDLFAVRSAADLTLRPELLDKLITVIDSGFMPPEEQRPLELVSRQQIVIELKRMLEAAVSSQSITVQTPIRRMNRFQYNNAVKDLFQLSVETYPLPERMMRDLGNYFQPQSEKMPLEVKVTSRPLGKDQTTEPHLRGLTPFPQDLRAELRYARDSKVSKYHRLGHGGCEVAAKGTQPDRSNEVC